MSIKLCYSTEIAGFKIELHQRRPDSFRVTYGLEIKDDLSYRDAALALGRAIMHASACEGKVRS